MKRFLALLLIVVFCAPYMAFGEQAGEKLFTTKSIPCPEGEKYWGEDYQKFSHLYARYADDKTPIPLSKCYDGYMYATIPSYNLGREIETFLAEDITFSDDNDQFEYYFMGKLSATGVITGDEMGRANPYDNVTRAEATAMVMRMLGLDRAKGAVSGFEDVPKDEWYANVIATARKYGVVNGDSETIFNPDRNVTHEEIIVMVARGVWATELKNENKTITKEAFVEKHPISDVEDISDWALSAYETIGTYSPSDFVENGKYDAEGFPDSDWYFYPQNIATRADIADVISRVIEDMQVYPSQTAIKYGFDKGMPVIDGSTSTYPFTEAVYGSLFSNGYHHPTKPQKHSKSHASYQRLINGEIDMIFASVYPAQDILKMAEENGVEFELIPIAYDAMTFFTNSENPSKGLTSQQISEIYINNTYKNWNEVDGADALLYPYCRNYDSGSQAQMILNKSKYLFLLCRKILDFRLNNHRLLCYNSRRRSRYELYFWN
ncbi:MAG: S-layer homology domain-containing protein [Eubacteriales bacterium]|nr:S-layer homology domain-containing protein [Eubacteriales bacterium]